LIVGVDPPCQDRNASAAVARPASRADDVSLRTGKISGNFYIFPCFQPFLYQLNPFLSLVFNILNMNSLITAGTGNNREFFASVYEISRSSHKPRWLRKHLALIILVLAETGGYLMTVPDCNKAARQSTDAALSLTGFPAQLILLIPALQYGKN
jgi:hypothetical protein